MRALFILILTLTIVAAAIAALDARAGLENKVDALLDVESDLKGHLRFIRTVTNPPQLPPPSHYLSGNFMDKHIVSRIQSGPLDLTKDISKMEDYAKQVIDNVYPSSHKPKSTYSFIEIQSENDYRNLNRDLSDAKNGKLPLDAKNNFITGSTYISHHFVPVKDNNGAIVDWEFDGTTSDKIELGLNKNGMINHFNGACRKKRSPGSQSSGTCDIRYRNNIGALGPTNDDNDDNDNVNRRIPVTRSPSTSNRRCRSGFRLVGRRCIPKRGTGVTTGNRDQSRRPDSNEDDDTDSDWEDVDDVETDEGNQRRPCPRGTRRVGNTCRRISNWRENNRDEGNSGNDGDGATGGRSRPCPSGSRRQGGVCRRVSSSQSNTGTTDDDDDDDMDAGRGSSGTPRPRECRGRNCRGTGGRQHDADRNSGGRACPRGTRRVGRTCRRTSSRTSSRGTSRGGSS